MPRGGRRPGAGAPFGNRNAVRAGYYRRGARGSPYEQLLAATPDQASEGNRRRTFEELAERLRDLLGATERFIAFHPRGHAHRENLRRIISAAPLSFFQRLAAYDRRQTIKQTAKNSIKQSNAEPIEPYEGVLELIARILLPRGPAPEPASLAASIHAALHPGPAPIPAVGAALAARHNASASGRPADKPTSRQAETRPLLAPTPAPATIPPDTKEPMP
jgi:hypothetical protein